MESLLLSVISGYLKDYVNNFTREQVSLNFLRGQGAIKNLDINVHAINDLLFQSDAPVLQFTRIMINTLSVEAPILNLKNKPIIFFIDRLFIEIAEVPEIIKKSSRKATRKVATSKYGFLDRVLDSVSVEVNRITVAFLTLGRMKATSFGAWTPPVLLLECSLARLYCTNHNGLEVELNECFRVRTTKRPLLFIYKKFAVERSSIYLVNPELWTSICDALMKGTMAEDITKLTLDGHRRGYVSQQIVSHAPLQIMICMRKRVDKNLLLGFELQVTLETIKIRIREQQLTELIHLVVGLYYCLLRQDALEEVFGPDPYNEGFKSCSSESRNSGVETACPPATPLNRKVDLSHFDSADKASLDRLDASMTSVGSTVVGGIEEERERGDDWHRSSLNSDVDPPHMRFCVVVQISEATIHIYVDPTDVSTRTQHLPSMSKSDADDSYKYLRDHLDRREARQPLVLIVNLSGLVHTTVWPEHASLMQAVQQTTLRHLKVTEQIGARKTCLLWTREPLDFDGRPMFIAPLPRGVKEYSHDDLETIPGTSLIFKKETVWPPPPVEKGLSVSSELCVCKIGICFKIETLDRLSDLFMRSWDNRIVSGDWGSDARGYLVNVLGGASSQSVIIMTGIDMVLSPFVDLNLPCHVERSCLSPSEVTLVLGLITLVSKPTLDVSSLLPLLDGDCQQQGDNNDEGSNDGEEERGQSNEEWNWQDAGESSEDTSGVINHFPYQTDDLTNILKIALERLNSQVSHRATSTSKPLVGSLPPRLKIGIEASLNGISLYISDDFPRSSPNPKSTTKQKKEDYSGNHSQSAEGITETDFCDSKFTRGDLNGPPRKQIIKPFSLHFITSLDLHPFLEDLRHPASNLNAYKREYYLSPTEETISTCYVSIETVAVNLSLLDMVRLLGTIETIQAVLPSSLTYRLLSGQTFTRANVGATRDTLIASEKTDNQPPTLSPLLLHSSSSPSTIFILKLNNAELCIVSEGNVSAPPILCLIAKRYYFVSESPSAAASAAIMPLPAHIDISGHASVAKRLDYRMVDKEKQSSHSIASSIETRVTFDDTKAVTHPAAASVTLFKIMCGNIYLTEGHRPLLYITGNKKISDALLTFMPHAAPNSRSGRDRRRLQADRTPFLAIRGHITNSMLTAAPYKLPSAAVSTADEVTPTVEDKEVCEKASLILYRSITLSTRLLCQKSPSADVATSSGKECGDGQKYGQDLMTGYVILDPSRVAVAIRNILRELLEGFGCVKIGASAWWEDTVYGYIKSRVDKLKDDSSKDAEVEGGACTISDTKLSDFSLDIDVSDNPRFDACSYRAAECYCLYSACRITTCPLQLLTFTSKGIVSILSLILLEMKDDSFIEDMTASLSQEDLCRYSALSIDFANVKVVTRKCCKNIDKVPGSDFSTSFVCSIATDMSSHLYSHPEDNSQDNTSSDMNSLNLIDPFPLRVDLSQRKLDSADASFESSVSVTDFASKLTTVHSNKSVHLLTRFCNHYESAIKLINEFRLSLQKETSMLLLPERFSFPDTTNDIKQISAKSLPLDSANDCLKYNQSKGSRFNSILTSSSTSQQEMISEMSQTLCSTQRDLHHLYQTSLLPAQSATAAIKDALLMCEELSEIAGKLHQASLLTACIDPTYCGWLRRSEGLLINPQSINTRECSSNWGIRSWAVLVRGSLLFMAKPYSSKVDFSIAMDSLFVSEPDESEAVALSSSVGSLEKSLLSSFVWCVAEKGTLVLDCGDEKHLWLDALFPWLITSGPRIKESSVLHTSSSSMASTSPAGGGGGGGGALGGRLGSEIFVAEQGIIIDSKGRGVQQIMTSSLSTAAAAMIGAMTIGGVEDVKGSSSSQGIAAVAANAKKLHLATSDLMRAFTASHSLPSNSNTSACNSKSKFGSGISVVNIEAPDTPFMSLTEIDRRSSTSAAKSVTPPLIREVTLVPSSSKRTFSNAKTTSNGNRLIDIEDEANADALEDYSGVLDLLDAVKYPLSNTKTFLQDALDLSQKVHMDTTSCFRSALQGVTQAVIGLSFLRTLADEVMERIEHEKAQTEADHHRRQSIAAVDSARETVRQLTEGIIHAKSLWGKADRRLMDEESLLQSCTLQHITTVMEMADRYDRLEEDYQVLSGATQSSETNEGSTSFKILLRDLKSSMADNNRLLTAAAEKEAFMAEEIASVVSDAVHSRMENMQMRSELKALRSQMALTVEANAASLAAEVGVRQKAESDRAVLESKLLYAISAIGQLREIV